MKKSRDFKKDTTMEVDNGIGAKRETGRRIVRSYSIDMHLADKLKDVSRTLERSQADSLEDALLAFFNNRGL